MVPMVVEELEIDVAPGDLHGYLAADAAVWAPFLASRVGFVRKEVWQPADRPGVLVLQIWWASREEWKAITSAEVDAVDRAMGEWYREPRVREYDVVWSSPSIP
jgi:uncharacterized protein (TIGR03792 family)